VLFSLPCCEMRFWSRNLACLGFLIEKGLGSSFVTKQSSRLH
jgi:hypothetical protein